MGRPEAARTKEGQRMNHRGLRHLLRHIGVLSAGVALIVVTGCAAPQRSSPDLNQVAAAFGESGFNQLEELRYTFNVQIGEKVTRRSWQWEPRLDRVTFNGTPEQGGRVTYERAALAAQPGEPLNQVDAWFINDNYWLLFPLRVHWDKRAMVAEDRTPAELPLGGGRARRIVVSYPPSGGYTPGDVYELYLDGASRITQWVYRKGGDPKPTRVTTWADYRRFGPLTLSLDRRGPDAGFRVWFTDTAVRLRGEGNWNQGETP
jgi:hypothetical protein